MKTIQDWEDERAESEILADIGAIAELPETTEPVTKPVADKPIPRNLMRRNYSGLDVSLDWHPATGTTIMLTEGENTPYVFTVPSDKALDAFWHPYFYDPR